MDKLVTTTDGCEWRGDLYAHGFSWRKRALVRDFTGVSDVHFVRKGSQVPEDGNLLLWGSAAIPSGVRGSPPVFRLEDGFIRSVGLGADLTRPISWVIDGSGIYFDPRAPSDLEVMLQSGVVSHELRERAKAFRALLVTHGLSKYNLLGPAWKRPRRRERVVLVAGQVETDASIALGAPQVKSNADLLQSVRRNRPADWIVYKPHPDVVAGLRRYGGGELEALEFADEVVTTVPSEHLLSQIDEIHVMTSLMGFEALLRGVEVHCHGLPFYAGWGLTQDKIVHPRRTRRLDLDELVAFSLLTYPRYVSLHTRKRCSPEQAVAELLELRSLSSGSSAWWRRWVRPLISRR